MSVGRYKPYPEYKESELDWLGSIPTGWTLNHVKHLAPFQVGWTPPTRSDANFEGENLWANISDLKSHTIYETAKRVSNSAVKSAAMTITPKGSLLYSFKLSVGTVSFAGADMFTNEAIASFLDHAKLPLTYLFYALPEFVIKNASTNIYGAAILNQELIRDAYLLAPSYSEAEQIAKFLDHETAKIDRLIEKQEALIRLLNEKRQAVISHAVTKGLNPDAPMKDSGIEWLGRVPAHWRNGPLKRFWDVVDCKHVTVPFLESGFRIASVMEVRRFELDLTDALKTSEAFYRLMTDGGRLPHRGDIIYCRNTANTGTSAYVNTDEPFAMGQDVVLIKSRNRNGRYLNYVLHGESMAKQLDTLMVGSTFKRINVADIRMLSVPCPPSGEQDQIVEFIDRKVPKFDRLINNAERAAALLQERRTALISAAVTGKIDVRESEIDDEF